MTTIEEMPWQTFRTTPLVAATFTPMHDDGSLNLDAIRPYVDALISDGIGGLYVGGTTGEGQALTSQERIDTAAEFIRSADGRIPVAVHVGHNSLREARTLAAHAADVGATAVSAMLPTHLPPGPVETMVDSLEFIAEEAPDLPFIIYHMASNGSSNVVELIEHAMARIPSVAGVKFTDSRLHELQACIDVGGDHLTTFFGVDEMLAGGLVAGAHSAIGSTYNFAAPLNFQLIDAIRRGDLQVATETQSRSAKMIRTVLSHGNLAAQKEVMAILGTDCGPCRLPQPRLTPSQQESLRTALDEIGFHQWAR